MLTTSTELRRWRTSCWTSASLHGFAVSGLLGAQLLGLPLPDESARGASAPISLVVRIDWEPSESPVVHIDMPRAQEPPDEPASPIDLQARIESAIAVAQERPVEEQRDELQALTNQLNNISTEKSVDEITDRLQQALGTTPRATAPADKPASGPFDTKTAQLHDVRREEATDGEFRYLVVLVDAAGRSFETELGPSEGEQLYRTWQLIKKNPLLERVYRGVVMQLLDKLLSSNR